MSIKAIVQAMAIKRKLDSEKRWKLPGDLSGYGAKGLS
jgi:hypothetical protein